MSVVDKIESEPVENVIMKNSVSVSPNPSSGFVNLKYNTSGGGKIQITVVDKTGLPFYKKEVYANKGENNFKLDLSRAISGMYYVEIMEGTNRARSNFLISR